MRAQTETFSLTVEKDGVSQTYSLNPDLTMGENLADLGGLSLGIQALTLVLRENGIPVEMYKPCYRIFFKSFANVWKSKAKPDYKIHALTTDPHSPAEFRANLVKNMDEFYDCFDVKEGDPMYISPDKRLRMW